MEYQFLQTPRTFQPAPEITLKDMGEIRLAPNEQVTFATASAKKMDIVQKEWGYYLGNSVNGTSVRQGFKTALVASFFVTPPRLYINLVEIEKIEQFENYLKSVNSRVVCWLDEWLKTDGKP